MAMEPGATAAVRQPFTERAEPHRAPGSTRSGLAAAIATEDPDAAAEFVDAYTGAGAFWNSITRLLDGFKPLRLPKTGIDIDRVPGPRGPVTFRGLYLRQYLVTPSAGPSPARDAERDEPGWKLRRRWSDA